MYFLLSSAVSICLQPLSWLLALLVALAFCRQEKWRKRLLFAALIVALVWFFFGPRKAGVATLRGGSQEIEITVKGGYSPDVISVRQGVPVRLLQTL